MCYICCLYIYGKYLFWILTSSKTEGTALRRLLAFTCPISCVLTDYYTIALFWSGCCAAFSRVCPRGRGWRRLHPGHKKRFDILRVTATLYTQTHDGQIHIHHDGTFYAHIHVMRDGNIQTLLLPIVNRSTPSRRSSYISRLDRVAADDQQQQFVSAVSSLFESSSRALSSRSATRASALLMLMRCTPTTCRRRICEVVLHALSSFIIISRSSSSSSFISSRSSAEHRRRACCAATRPMRMMRDGNNKQTYYSRRLSYNSRLDRARYSC